MVPDGQVKLYARHTLLMRHLDAGGEIVWPADQYGPEQRMRKNGSVKEIKIGSKDWVKTNGDMARADVWMYVLVPISACRATRG